MRKVFASLLLGGLIVMGGRAMGADKAEEGKPAPAVVLFAASNEKEMKVDFSEFKGKKNVVLFFYPKAMTGG